MFCWIPSRVGITGNENADQTSKSAIILLNVTAYPLRYSDTTSSIKNHVPSSNTFGILN